MVNEMLYPLPGGSIVSVADCDQCSDQMDEKSLSSPSGETVIEAADMEQNPELCGHLLLPLQECQRNMECLQSDDFLNVCSLKSDQCDEKSVGDSSSEYFLKVVEDNGNVRTDTNGEVGECIVPEVGDDCNAEEDTFQMNPDCGEKLASPMPSQHPDVEKDEFSERLSAEDLPVKYLSSVNSCSAGDHDNDGIEKDSSVPEVKYFDTIALSTQRSGRRKPTSQNMMTKRTSRKSRKKVSQSLRNTEVVFDTVRRSCRSCTSKPARSSIWGSLGHIINFFEKSDDVVVNQSQKQEKKKTRGNQGGAKRNKKQSSQRSHRSRKSTQGKCATSTNRIRLKVKLGNQVDHNFLNIVVPEVVDSSSSAKAIGCNYGNESYWEGNLEFPPLALGVEDQKAEEGAVRKICYSRIVEKGETCLDASVVKEQSANNDSSCIITVDKSSAKHADDSLCISSHSVEPVERESEIGSLEPGTSPDSEVINSILDIQAGATPQEHLQDSVLVSSEDFAASGNVPSGKKGRKKEKFCQADGYTQEGGSSVPASRNRSKSSKNHGKRLNVDDQLGSSETFTSSIGANVSNHSLTSEELSMELVPLSTDSELTEEALKAGGKTDVGSVLFGSENFSKTSSSSHSARKKLPKSSNCIKTSKGKSKAHDSECKIKNTSNERVYQRKSVNKSKIKKGLCDQVVTEVDSHKVTGKCLVDKPEKSGDIIASTMTVNLNAVQGAVSEQFTPPRNAWVLCDDCHKWRRIPASLVDSLGHASCTWTCKDNVDEAFADCSIPQEKSNAEINAELEISDDSGEENASNKRLTYKELECLHPTVHAVVQENKFASLSSNQFLHRSRKTQTIDEIMVCHCKPPLDGRLGCGDECLNRMLNIECVRGTCPCGDLCSNQQFQKRKYAKLKWLRCGKKGYGLQLHEDISKGKFLIEYVGEVLDMHAYEARQKEYALNGHRHFYFMTLNGSEVIDACGKGNLGRFINHSCDPNCRTEKWMVNGEICIGLFALRDIKKGEEVTFDYNYVRVFGAAAKKCYCGSSQCRGYIGGDPLNSEVIIQSDSDEEFPEPVMVRGDGRSCNHNLPTSVIPSVATEIQPSDSIMGVRDKRDESIIIDTQSKISEEKEDPLNLSASTVSPLHSSLEFEDLKVVSPAPLPQITHQTEDVTSEAAFVDRTEISLVDDSSNKDTCLVEQEAKPRSDVIDSHKNSKLDTGEDKQVNLKPYPRMKTSRKHGSVKKGKVSSSSMSIEKIQMTGNKLPISCFKPKRLVESSPSSRFEAVEEKLNELLDAEGGISKRKDAPKGYLKLLILTATSGASGNGEAIQSNRDLSMILDALLKTKSRVVLNDIINKNGLRMLHNIMKQYRSDFKKIPILRKLLKVLEYLVAREILTSEHINGGPPCPGMESLRESFLSLTEHDDKQVHQIARNFRDRWFPRHLRKFGYMEREDGRLEVYRGSNCSRFTASHSYRHDQNSRPTEAIDCVKQSMAAPLADTHSAEGCTVASTGGHSSNGQRTRKRKSRWDQPANTDLDLRSKEQKLEPTLVEQSESSQLNRVDVTLGHIVKVNCDDKNSSDTFSAGHQDETRVQNILEDIPPGFSSPFNLPQASSSAFSTVVDKPRQSIGNLSSSTVGQPQERYVSHLPVSYGIPFSIIQQFGTSQAASLESWDVAPGMPFHPFPPLPPYPRGKNGPPTSPHDVTARQPAHEGRFGSNDSHNFCSEENIPSTTGTSNQQDLGIPSNNQQILKRAKDSSYDLGRRYYKQQKWRNPKNGLPWIQQRRNQWGYSGNNFKGCASTVGVENVANNGISPYCSDEASLRVDKANCDFYQHSQHQNQR